MPNLAHLLTDSAAAHPDRVAIQLDAMEVTYRALDMATMSFQASHMRFWLGGVYARACRLTPSP